MVEPKKKKKESQIFHHPKDAGQTGATSFRDAVGGLPEAWGRSKIHGHSQLYTYRNLRQQPVTPVLMKNKSEIHSELEQPSITGNCTDSFSGNIERKARPLFSPAAVFCWRYNYELIKRLEDQGYNRRRGGQSSVPSEQCTGAAQHKQR